MTPERLRAHWFNGKRVPFWNHDPAQITVGLEIEYFIAKVDSRGAFKLATKAQYIAVVEYLTNHHGYVDRMLPDQPGRVSKDTESGFIAIKPDFAWHILEVAFPPRSGLEDIRSLLETTLREIDTALAAVGLQRLDRSCLPDIPEEIDLVGLKRLEGHLGLLNEHGKELLGPVYIFPALIAATHVHLNCFNEAALEMFPKLYQLEEKALQLFNRPIEFRGKLHKSIRTEFYEMAFGPDYKFIAMPKEIPDSVESYVLLLNSSRGMFPKDDFFPVRDLSYIRPTKHGTIEFRSACSYSRIDQILSIVEF
jgi:hypothetical protein